MEQARVHPSPLNHQMIAEDEHRKGGHLGVAATVARIRCRFLITIFQRLVKTTATSASYARGNSKDWVVRLWLVCPWSNCSLYRHSKRVRIDFFGPFTIKGEVQMRIHRKCNGLTFVCFSSRAVHVDISKDYSTDSFFQVMWQFSRRSTPIVAPSSCLYLKS